MFGRFAFGVDVAEADEVAGEALLEVAGLRKVGLAFAVGDGNGQEGALHPLQEEAGTLEDFDVGVAGLKLLGAVADKLGPVLGAGNDVLQLGNHLTAVADAEGEAVGALEEGLEQPLIPRTA